ncbi:protein farnesyltransferase/geranylgeranyltransferase type-1 subunit alpha [Neocloeon triangulifer]|uniref:protein farnesyltransferase/geranylgeranyltransferase type-1 subunit alpha n=1 Tax=Neocloeon triangulifer TaxID=2078957 RepID=UPI00286F89F6|nr:protein farnesyltransferase/geranylgeranyltransferase type-1 subunit alpha [Neocloeon triangulifer]
MTDSDSSGDECSLQKCRKPAFVFYRNREDWKDVVPIPQNDGPNPVVAINYSDKFKDVYDYLRAVIAKQEKSERALGLTEDALNLNPANYSVWQYRREILKHLKVDLRKELAFSANMIHIHPKNYQVWYHRKAIVEMLGDPSCEFELTRNDLEYDSKNYHAWQHRQWVIQTFGLYDAEMELCNNLIAADVRNNSAWNHRYFVVNNTTGFTPEVIVREVDYTLEQISKAIQNESAWNYLRGVLEKSQDGVAGNRKVNTFCENLIRSNDISTQLLVFLIDVNMARAKSDSLAAEKVKELCAMLANDVDPIRKKYWNYLAQTV